MQEVRNIKVIHLPCNVPYTRKIKANGKITICNGVKLNDIKHYPFGITFKWIVDHSLDDKFWEFFDVLHIHYGFEFEPIETVNDALNLTKAKEKGIVFTLHEMESVHDTNQNFYENYLRAILQKADSVITLTKLARASLQDKYPQINKKITVIPHGYVVSPENTFFGYTRKAHKEINFAVFGAFRENRELFSTLVNLYFATNSYNRGIYFLTKPVTKELLQSQPNVLSILTFIRSCEKFKLIMQPDFLDDEIADIIRKVDILILPYSVAGHSGQLALAMDLGVIPIISNVGFLQAQYEETINSDITKPPAIFINWNDGRHWKYQSRMISAILNVCKNIRLYREKVKSSIPGWKKYRQEEHSLLLERHYKIYLNCKKH